LKANPRHILIVGGTRGLGQVFAKKCCEMDWKVSVVSRKSEHSLEGVLSLVGDIVEETHFQKIVQYAQQKNGPLHSMAFFQRARGEGSMWREHLQVSVESIDKAVSNAIPFFETVGDKSILIASSPAANFVAPEQNAAYHASRAAQIGLMRYLAHKYGSLGIRANSISTGTVIKPENQEYFIQNSEMRMQVESLSPLGRVGRAEEVADAAEFLCSPRSSWITGQNLVCDGGSSLTLSRTP
jgi:NAD(P)-dependent dehydrogenase (short-subunit alcohol dehydrogenase family)